jgi:hypothetical protein
VQLRRPLDLLFVLGFLGWPMGLFGFGGFDNDAGGTIIGVGCLLLLSSLAVELLLRGRPIGSAQDSPDAAAALRELRPRRSRGELREAVTGRCARQRVLRQACK